MEIYIILIYFSKKIKFFVYFYFLYLKRVFIYLLYIISKKKNGCTPNNTTYLLFKQKSWLLSLILFIIYFFCMGEKEKTSLGADYGAISSATFVESVKPPMKSPPTGIKWEYLFCFFKLLDRSLFW